MRHHDPQATESGQSRMDRKKGRTRQRIFAAASRLFREKGYHETTVKEIAELADVGKGTVFNYFPKKDDLLGILVEGWAGRVLEELGPPAEWGGEIMDQLERLFLFIADLGAEDRELAGLAVLERLRRAEGPLGSGPPPGGAEDDAVRDILRDALSLAQHRGQLRADGSLEHMACLVEVSVRWTLGWWFTAGGPREHLEEEIRTVLKLLLDGLKA